jgi:hypothetical protein
MNIEDGTPQNFQYPTAILSSGAEEGAVAATPTKTLINKIITPRLISISDAQLYLDNMRK